MKKLYKLTQRKGRNIQVCFCYEPTKWISTGTTDLNEAHRFALARLESPTDSIEIKIKDFVNKLINSNFEKLRNIDKIHLKEKNGVFYSNLSSIAKRFINPIFGECIISKLTTKEAERRIANFETNNLTKNRIIDCLERIYKIAILENLATENIASKIEKYREVHEETPIFTKEEIKRIFTDDEATLEFTNLRWALYFYILRDTGWRPSEVLSLKFENIRSDGGVETSSAVVNNKIQNSIKTARKGFQYRIGIISYFARKLATELKLGANPTDFIFTFKGKFINSQEANRELAKTCKRIGIELGGRTQYSLRHSFNTFAIDTLQDKTRLELMGHTKNRSEYDHRDGSSQLEKLTRDEETKDKILKLYK